MPSNRILIAAVLGLCLAGTALAQPRLGRVATPDEIAKQDITIGPDGATLPPGAGSVADGLAVYEANCKSCHGDKGAGGPMDRLTGGIGSLTSGTPVKTVASYWPYATTIFDYVRRAMPYPAPQSLTSDEIYAVIAYLLSIDKIVPEDAVLSEKTLAQVRMPNRDGFISYYPKPPR
ncbi:MAG: cytochrome c [Alphaproteobacteria bacterium]|nr:cytochrome c [Alphaproteobacteria bacterium]